MCAYDGIEGERRALEEDIDLVILDMMLPGRDGFEVLEPHPRGQARPAGDRALGQGGDRGPRHRPRPRRHRLRHQAVLLRRAGRPRARPPAHARSSATRPRSRPAASASTCSPARSSGRGPRSTSRPRSSSCSPTSCATRTGRSPASRSSRPSGAMTSTRARTWSRSTSATCAASSRSRATPAPIETIRSVGLPAEDAVSIRARLTVLVAVTLTLALGGVFLATYNGTGNDVRAQIDRDLNQDATTLDLQGISLDARTPPRRRPRRAQVRRRAALLRQLRAPLHRPRRRRPGGDQRARARRPGPGLGPSRRRRCCACGPSRPTRCARRRSATRPTPRRPG